jgi:drug/metabolite transporter (DMT)-like permease
MFMYVFSIVLIVMSNILYNICQKSTPEKANPFSALFVTYLVAGILSMAAFYLSKAEKSFFQSFKELNWTSLILGAAIVGLEFGYIMAFRAGWNISVGSLVANIILAIALIPVGIFLYNEGFGPNKVLGVILCIAGLILINK